MKKLWIISGFMVIALTGSVLSWAATGLSSTLNIHVSPVSHLAGGAVAEVTPMSGAFTVTKGKAEVVNGVELYRIDLGSASFSNSIRITVDLLDPYDIGKALDNPNAWIDVGVWYPDSSGTHTLIDGTTKVSQDTSSGAIGRITGEMGEILLYPNISNQTTLYILASITAPGGVPPGQQTQIGSLQFYCSVRGFGS